MKNKKKFWLIIGIIFLIAAAVAGGIQLAKFIVEKQASGEREELAEDVNRVPESSEEEKEEPAPEETVSPEPVRTWADYTMEEKYRYYLDTYGIEVPEKNLDFEQMRAETNGDIYAWVCVPGTNIDDPVVQHPTDDSYYLNHNLDGSKGYPGGIYTESCNKKDFSDRMTVIYGHNMKNKKGFATLHKFEKKEFFDENRYIYIYTPDDILVYEIFASYEGSSSHIIYGHDWDDESWVQYLSDTLLPAGKKDNALPSYAFTAEDKVVTLLTCIWNSPNQRYLVQGVLLDEGR